MKTKYEECNQDLSDITKRYDILQFDYDALVKKDSFSGNLDLKKEQEEKDSLLKQIKELKADNQRLSEKTSDSNKKQQSIKENDKLKKMKDANATLTKDKNLLKTKLEEVTKTLTDTKKELESKGNLTASKQEIETLEMKLSQSKQELAN